VPYSLWTHYCAIAFPDALCHPAEDKAREKARESDEGPADAGDNQRAFPAKQTVKGSAGAIVRAHGKALLPRRVCDGFAHQEVGAERSCDVPRADAHDVDAAMTKFDPEAIGKSVESVLGGAVEVEVRQRHLARDGANVDHRGSWRHEGDEPAGELDGCEEVEFKEAADEVGRCFDGEGVETYTGVVNEQVNMAETLRQRRYKALQSLRVPEVGGEWCRLRGTEFTGYFFQCRLTP